MHSLLHCRVPSMQNMNSLAEKLLIYFCYNLQYCCTMNCYERYVGMQILSLLLFIVTVRAACLETQLSCMHDFAYKIQLNFNFQSPTPPQYVFWQKNDRMINYDDTRRDISIDTTPGPRTQSRLIIREPQISDSGNYTCSASNTEPASIYVFVSKGKLSHRLYIPPISIEPHSFPVTQPQYRLTSEYPRTGIYSDSTRNMIIYY